MIKLVLSILLTTLSFANIKNADVIYDISYGIFGKLGVSTATIKTKKDNSYTIDMKAQATGFAKYLSGELVEIYKSTGRYENNRFKPDYFKKTTKQHDKTKIVEYKFNYTTKKILLTSTIIEKKYENIDELDLLTSHFDKEFTWETTTTKRQLEYWANEDILSLFFNINFYIKDVNKQTEKSIITVGAGSSRGGKIDIEVTVGEDKKAIADILETNKNILIVRIYKDIFTSKNGELYISLNEKGLCNRAILKDVLFFGDVIGDLQ